MKKWLYMVLLVAFVGTAVFGFSTMNHNSMHEAGHDCIIAVLSTSLCPQHNSGLAMSFYHLDAYHEFSSSTLLVSITALLSVVAALFVIALTANDVQAVISRILSYFARREELSFAYSLAQEPERSWRSRLTNSPSYR